MKSLEFFAASLDCDTALVPQTHCTVVNATHYRQSLNAESSGLPLRTRFVLWPNEAQDGIPSQDGVSSGQSTFFMSVRDLRGHPQEDSLF